MSTTSGSGNRLQFLPASFFGMIMGLTGLSIALENLTLYQSQFQLAASAVLVYTTLIALVLGALYTFKLVRFPQAVKAELTHPIKMNFVPTISISMLLLSIAFLGMQLNTLSYWLWLLGAALQLVLTYWVLYNWVHHDLFTPEHSNPAWFIPIVGNIIVPIAGVEHAHLDVSWFFFAIGIVFWIVVKAVLMNRIIFHAPIQAKLIPTLAIFIAPPAVGFISYLALNQGELNQFAKILYFFALVVTLLMLVSIDKFGKLSFALSWWAFTFPLAAMSIASYKMYGVTTAAPYLWIAVGLNALLLALVVWFSYKTLRAIMNKQVCVDH